MSNIRLVELTEGFSIPQIGLASFRKESPEETKVIIRDSLAKGLRYFEISELFCNGHIILEALSEANIDRSEVFLSLKVWPKDRTPGQLLETTKNLLKTLRLEYMDLILMHAPICVEHRFDQWKTMEELKHCGLANVIGVANISMNELMTVMKNCEKLPQVIEVPKICKFFLHQLFMHDILTHYNFVGMYHCLFFVFPAYIVDAIEYI